jgi:signal transduction histidine kinase
MEEGRRMSIDEEAERTGSDPELSEVPLASDAVERRSSHLGFVAHEIRNPLSTALWTAELLGRMDPVERGGARGEKLSAMCMRSLQRVRHLMEDHLLSERLDAGGYPVRPEAVPVLDALVAAEGRRVAVERSPEYQVAPDLALLADRTLFDRLLDTLLDAAAQGAGEVVVAGAVVDGEVLVRFRGAAPDARALEDPMKGGLSDTRGRSLALPAARRIAARMGGRLTVEGDAWVVRLPEALPDRGEEG